MQRILLERNRVDAELLAPALDALAAGELVVVPTETLYLLAGGAESEARLKEVESRLEQRSDSAVRRLWLGTPEMMAQRTTRMPLPAQRLVQRYWPGPLAVRLSAAPAVPEMMAPAEPVTQELLTRHGEPLHALELPVEPPASDAIIAKRAVRKLAGEELLPRYLLDSGPSAYGAAPTRIEVAAFALREVGRGPLEPHKLVEAARVHVCFVCTGNICRSPLAAAMLRALAQQDAEAALSRDYEVVLETSSCGSAALTGSPATPEAHDAAKPHGADEYLKEHRAKRIAVEDLKAAEMILAAAREHRDALLRLSPELESRIFPLDPTGKDLRDPYMESPRVYEQVAQVIQRALTHYFFEPPRIVTI